MWFQHLGRVFGRMTIKQKALQRDQGQLWYLDLVFCFL